MLTKHTVQVENHLLNLVFDTEESGPPLLFLHGVTRCWQDFMPIIPSFMPRWQTAGLDFPGHGKSSQGQDDYLVIDYVRDVVKLLRQHFLTPVVIYGHSLGAMVAAAVAAEAPEKVSAIVLEDPPFGTMGVEILNNDYLEFFTAMQLALRSNQTIADLACRLAQLPIKVENGKIISRIQDIRDAASIRFSARCLLQMDSEVLSPVIQGRWLEGYNQLAILKKISCPTLLLQANVEFGGMLGDEDAQLVETLISDCIKIRFENSGHLIHWQETEATIRYMMAFLESLLLDESETTKDRLNNIRIDSHETKHRQHINQQRTLN